MMAYSTDSKSAAVRAQLDHPVIDGDGHWLEPVPIFLDYLREVAGSTVGERFRKMATAHIDRGWYDMTPAERLDRRPTRPTWWAGRPNSSNAPTRWIRNSSSGGLATSGMTSRCPNTCPASFPSPN